MARTHSFRWRRPHLKPEFFCPCVKEWMAVGYLPLVETGIVRCHLEAAAESTAPPLSFNKSK